MADRWGIRRNKELPPGPPPPIPLGTGQAPVRKPWWQRTPYVIGMGVLALLILVGSLTEEEAPVKKAPVAIEDVLPRATTTTRRPTTAELTTTTTLPPTTTTAATAPPVTQGFRSAPPPSSNCDSSYPDFCIAPPPPDLDCGSAAIQDRKRFTVLQPDPHEFDQDRDGVGCES